MVGKTAPAERNTARGASEEHCRQQHNSADGNCRRELDQVGPNNEDGSTVCRLHCSNTGISVEDRFELLNMKEEELEEEEDGSLGLLSFDSNDTSDYSLSGTAWWNFWT